MRETELAPAAEQAQEAIGAALVWLGETGSAARDDAVQAGARRFALTLGRSLELLLLTRHAVWALERGDAAPVAAAWRLATSRIDHTAPLERNGSSETSPPPPPS